MPGNYGYRELAYGGYATYDTKCYVRTPYHGVNHCFVRLLFDFAPFYSSSFSQCVLLILNMTKRTTRIVMISIRDGFVLARPCLTTVSLYGIVLCRAAYPKQVTGTDAVEYVKYADCTSVRNYRFLLCTYICSYLEFAGRHLD